METNSGSADSSPANEPAATSRKVSLLLVCRSYPPVIGGSEIEAQRVCAALRERGHRVEVVCCGGSPMPPGERFLDPFGTPVRMFGRSERSWADYVFAAGVARTIWQGASGFDFVYFLMPGIHLAVGLPVARLMNKRILMKFSGSNEVRKLTFSPMGRLELGFLRRWAARVMLLNDGMMQEALEAGFENSKLLPMPNPVDTDDFKPGDAHRRAELRRNRGLADTDRLAVFVGRLAPEKELPTLVSAFARVTMKCPKANLALIGNGPLGPVLQKQAAELGLGQRVRFAGAVDSAGVRDWLQAADVFVLVSSLEGLPVSLIEAWASGLPAVTSDIPAMTGVLRSGINGLLTPLKNEEAIADALIRLFNDPALRMRMGAAGRREAVERFSTRQVVRSYESLFAELRDDPTG
jgi:glycosyltransferase involved in cell wall biosynthesis